MRCRRACDAASASGEEEQLLAAGGTGRDVDGRVDPPLGQLAAQDEFAVAGALELLEDDLIHLGAGVHQRRGDDGERPAPARGVHVPGAAQEALGLLHRVGVQAARQRPPGSPLEGVVGAREPGDGIEDDDRVAPELDLPPRPLQGQFRHLGVALGGLVEARRHHLPRARHLHLRHFLGPLVHQQDEELRRRVIARHALRHRLQHRGLARLGRRHDERPLSLAEGTEQVDEAGDFVGGPAGAGRHLERQHFLGVAGGQLRELGAPGDGLGREVVDAADLLEARPAALAATPALTGDRVAGAEAVLLDELGWDEEVAVGGSVSGFTPSDEGGPAVGQFQDAQKGIGHDTPLFQESHVRWQRVTKYSGGWPVRSSRSCSISWRTTISLAW